jgi:hypothetical protein
VILALISLIISIVAVLAALGSVLYARRMWRIERTRYHAARQPRISAVYEDFGGHYPGLEFTNDGNEDLVAVNIELLAPIPPYHAPITAIGSEQRITNQDGSWHPHVDRDMAGRTVSLGALAISETKRILIYRDDPVGQFGLAILYAYCTTEDKSEWRISIKADVPKSDFRK